MYKRATAFPVLLVMLAGPHAIAAQTGIVEVLIEGVRNSHGHVLVALFQNPAGFPQDSANAFRTVEVPAVPGSPLKVELRDIPNGSYAIAIFHDENDNRKLDKTAIGKPAEGYGVSNNAKHMFRAPDFEEARFDFDGKSRILRIKLNY